MKILVLMTCLGLVLSQCDPTLKSDDHIVIKRPPDTLPAGKRSVYIAGLFGIHDSTDGTNCEGALQDTSVQNLMAFLYGIETIKQRKNKVNTDYGLGGVAFDTCKSNGKTIQNVMNFETCTIGAGDPHIPPEHTFGYIGPETIWTHDVAPVIASFKKTQIAFSSTHPMFADKERFPFLLRTVPDDEAHVSAIGKFLSFMEYKAVQFVYVDSGMGRSAKELFEKMAEDHGMCVEQYISVPEDTDDVDEYHKAVVHLAENPSVKAVVMWFDKTQTDQTKTQAQAFIEAVKAKKAQGMFFWVTTDAWYPFHLTGLEQTSEGAVLITPSSSSNTAFETYFRGLKPDGQPQVFRDYWMNKFDCDLPESTARAKTCDPNNESLAKERVNPRAGFIIDAVTAMADGILNASQMRCHSQIEICDDFLSSPDHLLMIKDKIRDTKDENIMFNSTTGDVRNKKFDIFNLRRPTGNMPAHDYEKIGSLSQQDDQEVQITLDRQKVHLYDGRGMRISDPESYCPLGSCDTCAAPTQPPVVKTTSKPEVLETTSMPEEARPYHYVRMKSWIIPLIVLAGLGILITIMFEIYVLSKLIGTQTVKQFRTMWLGQLLLVGILLSYLLLFAFVPTQTPFTCGLIRFGVGTCYAIMFSVLLVKLMIILSSESIGYLKGVYQVLMFIFAWAVQIVIDAEWLILVPPTTVWNEDLMATQCAYDYLGHIQSLVYVMFLILVCTIIAAHSHGIITNHREGIFIGLAAGFSIPIWIAWTLVGSLNENTEFQEPTLAYGLLINTTLILFTMFLPKVRQLNTMGMEGIYLEDDANENEAYGSVIYGPPSYPGSQYQVNGLPMIAKDGNGQPVQLIPSQQILYDQYPSLMRSTAGSVRSVPAYARTGNKTLRVTGDLTGRHPFDRKAASEMGYKSRGDLASKAGTLKRSGSNTDLGAL